ncbi:DNA/RNA non-specific endonuclease [Lactobacillus intestinalis]|uniref:DNA/RNA non-specific endonuclease n=1 Tax=Lactobacillus intestinalis TaxID=151781 RepID=UPI003EBE28BA
MFMARKTQKKKQGTLYTVIGAIIIIAWGIFSKDGNFNLNNLFSSSPSNTVNNAKRADTYYGGLSKTDYDQLAKLDFKSGDRAYIDVNHNKSTLIKNAWKVNKVIYSNLDSLNRTSHSNTAFLEKRNVANDSLRVRQFVQPTGWHYNHRNGTQIYNRGHLIAYSISAGIDQDGNYNPNNQSGDQNNPKNLFTQSAYSNQKIQTIFESKVRRTLRENKRVIYQATPIFRGNELMARGINLQAISTDGSLDFNVYLFNVQPGFVYNYNDGRAKIDRQMIVKQ